jgi:hypothetical protein
VRSGLSHSEIVAPPFGPRAVREASAGEQLIQRHDIDHGSSASIDDHSPVANL